MNYSLLYSNFIPCNLLDSLILCSDFSVDFGKYKIISLDNTDSFTSSFTILNKQMKNTSPNGQFAFRELPNGAED